MNDCLSSRADRFEFCFQLFSDGLAGPAGHAHSEALANMSQFALSIVEVFYSYFDVFVESCKKNDWEKHKLCLKT